MLKESYLAKMRRLPKDIVKIVVTRAVGHVLSPSNALLWDYKNGNITWEEYERRFYQEMDNEIAKKAMREIKLLAKDRDVFLICYEKQYPCHRFLLIDMINKLDEEEKKDI